MINFGDPECRVEVCGKQVMLDGRHFADAVTPEAAHVIGMSLFYCGREPSRVPAGDAADLAEFFR